MAQAETLDVGQLITPRQLAGVLGLDPETVRRAARAGVIPSVQFGAAWRFTPEHVREIRAKGWKRARRAGAQESI